MLARTKTRNAEAERYVVPRITYFFSHNPAPYASKLQTPTRNNHQQAFLLQSILLYCKQATTTKAKHSPRVQQAVQQQQEDQSREKPLRIQRPSEKAVRNRTHVTVSNHTRSASAKGSLSTCWHRIASHLAHRIPPLCYSYNVLLSFRQPPHRPASYTQPGIS